MLRSAVELCGRHPLASGVVAILGIGGLILSVVGFQFDRQDAAQTTEQISDLRQDLVKEDVFKLASLHLSGTPYEFRSADSVTYCAPANASFTSAASDFFAVIMANQNEVVFLDFGVDLGECNILEDAPPSEDTEMQVTLKAGHYMDFSSAVYAYAHPGLNPEYVEKSQDRYSPAFVVYFDRVNTTTRKAEEYVATFWPPLSELRSYTYNADEYGLNLVSGLFRIVISSASGGYGIELLPVEAIDFAKYERTLEGLRN